MDEITKEARCAIEVAARKELNILLCIYKINS